MADKKHTAKQEEKDPEVVIGSAIDRTENFLHDNGKTLLIILGVIVLVVGGYFGYKYLVAQPRAEKASAMMFVAQQQFEADKYNEALNGSGNNPGFLSVISKYGSSPEANLAHHYAGICYLKMGEMDKALASFGEYKTTNGAPNALVNARNYGLMGDIHSQQKNYEQALAEYRKAVEAGDNSYTAPQYLKKMGLVLHKLGRNDEAIAAFEQLRDNYPQSMEARDIDKLIGQFGQE